MNDTSAEPRDQDSPSEPQELDATSQDHVEQSARPPSFLFFGIVSAVSLLADVTSKAWAEVELGVDPLHKNIVLVEDHLTFTLAYNRGGAWGLLQDASEEIRKPFFFLVSLLAIAFIVSLYGRIAPGQRALKWGLPLVLGGALGNLSDRVMRSSVIDFIDFRASWVASMNRGIAHVFDGWGLTDHWPTFNVADIAICIGVGLMAIDMFTSRRTRPHHHEEAEAPVSEPAPAPAATDDRPSG